MGFYILLNREDDPMPDQNKMKDEENTYTCMHACMLTHIHIRTNIPKPIAKSWIGNRSIVDSHTLLLNVPGL